MSWRSPKPTVVYFFKPVGMKGPIKIGCSASPENRKSSLETWSPFALEILASIPGDTILERRFHNAFFHLHERREWFSYGDDLWACIEAIKAGTFDTASLPEPRRVCNRAGKPRSDEFRLQMSYSLRVGHAARRTGYRCAVSTSNMIAEGDVERTAAVDAYLADPVKHGISIAAEWAAQKRKAA